MPHESPCFKSAASQFRTPKKQIPSRLIASPPGHESLSRATRSLSLDEITSEYVRKRAHEMIEYVHSNGMISLASNQLLGGDLNIFVFRVPSPEEALPAYKDHYAKGEAVRDWNIVINGEYKAASDSILILGKEGSVSGCDIKEIKRWSKIHARWYDEFGHYHEETLEGLAARIFQNKVCYLNGISIEELSPDFVPPRNIEEIKHLRAQMDMPSSHEYSAAAAAATELSHTTRALFTDDDEAEEVGAMGGLSYLLFPKDN